ncbi:hypothetical protein FSP39_005695 [Pinctada imbricata]|uniref:Uncharacterized protein n=1 Tax=Pinctada imbricata TaxID=66713 RepID=A0AA88Y2B2_PINIB|nr:hypothetical protein FSP39_005695 [Pinctada imbricata]
MVSFQLWRKINAATNKWQLKFTSPVYMIPSEGVVKIDVRHLDTVVWSMDKLGFLDLSMTPCVTFRRQSDPLYHTQSLLYRSDRSELLSVQEEGTAIPFQVSMDFNVRAKTEPYLGTEGAQGITGISGVRGGYGDTGYVGLQGPRGQRGEKGPIGSQGSIGPQGQTGFNGWTGERGDQGTSGGDNSPGIPGDTGEVGDTGFVGKTGDGGFSGADGDVGPEGTVGDVGDAGFPGEPGDTLIGVRGPKGVQGDIGSIGLTGGSGDPGLRGIQGDEGYLVGERGPPGDPGSSLNPFGYDWCSASNLVCTHACSNTGSSAECICPQGYSLSDDGSCKDFVFVDVDECGGFICDAEQVCVNVEGRHECLGPYTVRGLVGKVASAQTMDGLLSTGTMTGITAWMIILSIVLIIEILLFFYIVSRENRTLYRPMQVLMPAPEEPKVYVADRDPGPSTKHLSLPKISYISYPSEKRPLAMLDSVPYGQVQKLRLSRSNSLF